MIFIKEYLWAILTLIGFSFAGGFIVIPFQKAIRYRFFAAPFAGILVMPIVTSAIYNLLFLSLTSSAKLAFVLCFVGTMITCVLNQVRISKPNLNLVIFAAVIIGFITYLTNYTTLFLGHPGFLYMDGTDHLGYAHLADWLNNQLINQQPEASLKLPYQSWPNLLFNIDPRFGSFFTLAIISAIRNQSGMFAYDFASSIVLSASMLAVAAIFARSAFTFILLVVGLLTSHWFDYSRSGYFGKLLGYPATLYTVGLFLIAPRPITVGAVASLAILAVAASVMHSYIPTLLFLVVVGGPFIVICMFYLKIRKQSLSEIKNDVVTLGLLLGSVVAATGVLSRPAFLIGTGRDMNMTWRELLPRIFDLESNGVLVTGLNSHVLLIIFFLSFLIVVTFLILAMIKQEKISASLIAGPALLLVLLAVKEMKWPAYQLIGTIYPYFLCAAIRVIDCMPVREQIKNNKKTYLYYALTPVLVLCIALHLPRFRGAINRYSSANVIKSQEFSKVEIDQLAELIGDNKAVVDIKLPSLALALLVELGRRNMTLEWTPNAWTTILGYRPLWPAPKLDETTKLWIVSNDEPMKKNCALKYKTAQYNLLVCSKGTIA